MRRRGLLVTVTVVALAGLAAGPAVAAPASRSTIRPAGAVGTHYAVARPVCGAPAPGRSTCLAVRRVPVAKGTPGAHSYDVPRSGFSTGPAGGYTPADLARAYGFDPAGGAGQTVAVVDAYDDPTAEADLDAFDAQYALATETADSFVKVGQDGSSMDLPAGDTSGWSAEESLDVDAVRAVCHGCRILLVETDTDSEQDLATGVRTAVALGATEVSNSYGSPEDPSQSGAAPRAEYNFPGVVVTAASGDDGWYGWDVVNEGYASDASPWEPASVPGVVAVGGTTLRLNDDDTRLDEVVWNGDGPDDQNSGDGAVGASGGGCSIQNRAPGWQSHMAGYGRTGCDGARLSVDIAAVADPYTGFDIYDSYNSGDGAPGWATYGGTSLSAPIIAAMWALAGGAQGVSYPAMTLYGQLTRNARSLHDVTAGGNGYCGGDTPANCAATGPAGANPNGIGAGPIDCSFTATGGLRSANTQCNAAVGYDGPSGVGTPNGLGAFMALHPAATVSRSGLARLHHPTRFIAHLSDAIPGGVAGAHYRWTWGDGSSSAGAASRSHTYRRAGTYRITLTATDAFGLTTSATTKVTLGKKPTIVLSGPKRLAVGQRGRFTVRRSRTPNSGARIVSESWRWGDGSPTSHGKRASHRYLDRGRHTAVVRVTDSSGVTAKRRFEVHVTR